MIIHVQARGASSRKRYDLRFAKRSCLFCMVSFMQCAVAWLIYFLHQEHLVQRGFCRPLGRGLWKTILCQRGGALTKTDLIAVISASSICAILHIQIKSTEDHHVTSTSQTDQWSKQLAGCQSQEADCHRFPTRARSNGLHSRKGCVCATARASTPACNGQSQAMRIGCTACLGQNWTNKYRKQSSLGP